MKISMTLNKDTEQIVKTMQSNLTAKSNLVVLTKVNQDVIVTTEEGQVLGALLTTDFDDKNGRNVFANRDVFNGLINEKGEITVIRYAPLHGHSGYSMLDGASHIEDMAKVSEFAMALTDHGNMFGSLDFYKKMKKANKKPIIGCEVYSESRTGEMEAYHLILLAETTQGYHNLMKLVSKAHENKYRKPQVKYEWLRQYKEGIIVTSACLGSEVDQAIINGNVDEAREVIREMVDIFGTNHYFIEIQRHDIEEEKIVNPTLLQLAKEFGLKVIATADSHYTHEEDREAQEILLCISTATTMENEKRMVLPGHRYHIHSSEEMEELFSDMPEVLDNTLEIAERCQVDIELGKNYLPHFDVPAPFASDKEYFIHLCKEGFKERFEGTPAFKDPVYHERLDYEISVINKMGFPGYFLIMWDVVKFAQSNDILVGPGRGSACGSLVAYVLNITDVDPIPYGLLFERFLNEDRYSMPDIDTDFPDNRREEIIEYCRQKYGEKSVARIMTVTRLTAKSVIRDVTRALGYSYGLGGKLSSAVPNEPGMTLAKAMDASVELRDLYENNPDATRIMDVAFKLENTPKTTGIHACGVVISSNDVDERVPTFLSEDEDTGRMVLTTQYDKDQNEECGLLKMDFLGLRTMGVLEEAIRTTNLRRVNKEKKERLTSTTIPTADVGMYQNISHGNTAGIFQLEQPGMTKFMKQLFSDADAEAAFTREEFYNRLFAGIALYRPGPMDEIPNYLNNMANIDNMTYDAPELEPILKSTYGIIVYQEQCMQIVRDLAGFSRGQSDIIRKGMAKKQKALLDEYEPAFLYGSEEKNIEGCLKRGIPEEKAKVIWDKMIKFSEYAFNKSHAVGYSYVSAKTGYLATYYPVEYLTATMNSFISKGERIKKYISVAKKQNIQVLPPDINKSKEYFSVDGDSILFGLKGIRSVGKTSLAIINERKRGGKFEDMKSFVVRMSIHQEITSRALQSLIFAGALDCFAGTRKEKLLVMDEVLSMGKFIRDNQRNRKATLFLIPDILNDSLFSYDLPGKDELDNEMKLEKEKEYAGFYITGHPLTAYQSSLTQSNYMQISDIIDDLDEKMELKGTDTLDVRGRFAIAGVITEDVNTFYTKKSGEPLKVFKLEDETGDISCTAFSKTIYKNQGLFEKGQLLFAEGHISVNEGEYRFTIENVFDLHDMRHFDSPSSYLVVGNKDVKTARLQYKEVRELAQHYTETMLNTNKPRVKLFFQQGNKIFDMKLTVPYTVQTQQAMADIVGKRGVKAQYQ